MKTRGLSGNALKIIAMVTMLCDHVGKILLPQYPILSVIGRLSFPLFAYMLAEGCFYTKNRRRHLLTVLLFALFCQAVCYVATGLWYQNILITFSLSIGTIFALDLFLRRNGSLPVILAISVLLLDLFLGVILPILTDDVFLLDYGIFGVLLPVGIYYAKGPLRKLLMSGILLAIFALFTIPIQWYALLSLPLLALYNGTRGRLNLKYLFYLFYPAHLGLIYLIAMLLAKG